MKPLTIRLLVGAFVTMHLVLASWHGHAHEKLSVALSTWQWVFVYGFIVSLPVIAALAVWTWRIRTAVRLFTLAMLASLIFGVYFHYIADTPDNISCLPPGSSEWRRHYIFSSAALACLELAAVLYGAFAWRHRLARDSRDCASS